jgi:hypothetical protein
MRKSNRTGVRKIVFRKRAFGEVGTMSPYPTVVSEVAA